MAHPMSGIPANIPVKTFHDKPVRSLEEARAAAFEILTYRHSGPRMSEGFYDWKLASNVYIRDRNEYVAVVLYETEIVRYYEDGTFSVDNGGYNTPTTRTRICQFTPDWFSPYHNNKKLWYDGECTHDRRFPVERPTPVQDFLDALAFTNTNIE